jgi:hypothetical protein
MGYHPLAAPDPTGILVREKRESFYITAMACEAGFDPRGRQDAVAGQSILSLWLCFLPAGC